MDLGVIAHALEKTVRQTRGAAAARGDLRGSLLVKVDPQNGSRAHDNLRELGRRIVVEARDDAEPVAQGTRQKTGARRRTHKREARQVEPDGTGGGALADHDVEIKVLHSGIEDLFHCMVQTVNLVDEEHVAFLQVRKDGSKVAGPLDGRARGALDLGAHLVCHNGGKCGLTQTRRAEEEQMVEAFATLLGRLDGHAQGLFHALLANIVVKELGAKLAVDVEVFRRKRRRNGAFGGCGGTVTPKVLLVCFPHRLLTPEALEGETNRRRGVGGRAIITLERKLALGRGKAHRKKRRARLVERRSHGRCGHSELRS